MNRRIAMWAWGIIGVLLALYCLAIWFDLLPWLRGWGTVFEGGWTWPFYQAPVARLLPVALAACGIWCLVLLAERLSTPGWKIRAVKTMFLTGAVLLGYLLQLSLLGLKADNANRLLAERVFSPTFTSYYSLAVGHPDPADYFADYPSTFYNNPYPHTQTHPPGPALYYWLALRVAGALPENVREYAARQTRLLLGVRTVPDDTLGALTDAQLLAGSAGGTLVLLLASLTVVPLFGLARLLGPPGYEYRLAALGPVLPGLALMAPMFDQAYALLSATALYTALRGLASPTGKAAAQWAALAGVAIAVGLFCTWAFAFVPLVIIALGVLAYLGAPLLPASEITPVGAPTRGARVPSGQHPDPPIGHPQGVFLQGEVGHRTKAGLWLLGLAAGIALPLAVVVAAGLDLAYVFTYNMGKLAEDDALRPYWPWVIYGPLDFIQFLGLPLAFATTASLIIHPTRSASGVGSPAAMSARPRSRLGLPAINAYAAVFWLLLIFHDLAGKSRGELGRTLIFLMPLALVSVYWWAYHVRSCPRLIALLFFAQALVCAVIGARWFVP